GAMGGTWLGLLKEIDPRVTRVLAILNPGPGTSGFVETIKAAASTLGIQLTMAEPHDAVEIENAIVAFAHAPHGSLVALPSLLTTVHRGRVLALAARHRLPAVYPYRFFATDGGLMSYGVDL